MVQHILKDFGAQGVPATASFYNQPWQPSRLLKKPAAQQKAGMKRPAAHEKEEKPPKTHKKNGKDKEEEEEDDEIVEPLPLTEEALQSHNKFLSEMSKHKDMSQTQFDKTLATLPSRTAERLWKAFEACRKETGSDGQYKEASSGCGQQKKQRALLRGWCMDKGKIGDCYRKMLTTVRVVAKQGVEEKWITKAEALPEMGGRGTEGSTAERHHQSSPQSLGQGLLGVPSHC